MAALDAIVITHGPQGERRIPLVEFHRLPGDTPQIETVLLPGELITAVDLPAGDGYRRSHYRKVRDRASYAFALVSVAAALNADATGTIKGARIALGGVAHKPWRAFDAEAMLVGKKMTESGRLQARGRDGGQGGQGPGRQRFQDRACPADRRPHADRRQPNGVEVRSPHPQPFPRIGGSEGAREAGGWGRSPRQTTAVTRKETKYMPQTVSQDVNPTPPDTTAAKLPANVPPTGGSIGAPISRVDGKLKVTGGARYSAEMPVPDALYGVMVMSTVPASTITSMDTKAAEGRAGRQAGHDAVQRDEAAATAGQAR